MKTLEIIVPLDIPRGPAEWARFRSFLKARLSTVEQLPDYTRPVGLGFTAKTMKPASGGRLLSELRRVMNSFQSLGVLTEEQVYFTETKTMMTTGEPSMLVRLIQ